MATATGSALRRRKAATTPKPVPTAEAADSPGVKARIDALTRKLRAAEAKASEAEATAAEVARLRAHLTMRTSDRPGLSDPEVCDFLVERYHATTAALGDKAPEFDAWFASQLDKPSPLLAPYLAKPEPKVEPAAPGAKPKPPVPNPNAGAGNGIPDGARTFTDDEIAGWDDATWRLNAKQVEQQLVEAGKIRPIRKPATA